MNEQQHLKKPSLANSSDTARVVSRRLANAGFEMSKKIDRWSRTNGFIVKRLGCSKTIYVDYWNPAWMKNPTSDFIKSEVEFNREKLQLAVNFLASLGYPIDSRGYVECENSY